MIIFPARRTGARRSSWMLLVVLVIALCAVSAIAQDKTAVDNPDAATTDVAPPETKETAPEPTKETATEEPTSKETSSEETTTQETTKQESTTDSEPTKTKTSESETTTDSEPTTSSETTSSSEKTSSSKADHPEITVPPTADAPYMQKSNTPEGTVFIAVGAVLGFLGFAVLAWRGMVAWSVNRSVRQAALIHSSESKGLLRSRRKRSTVRPQGPVAPVSLEKMGGNKRASRHMHQRSSKVPSSSSGLFFSPTAGMQNSGNRASNYLPAGYYAAGNATAGGSSGGHHTHFSDLPGVGPQSQGYTRTKSGPSPPGTPTQQHHHHHHTPSGGAHEHPHNASRAFYYGSSTSDVNLSPAPQGRTPSAYLEDLFENHAPQRNQNRRYRG